jgi:hypothetical protein
MDHRLVEVVNRCLAKRPEARYQTLSDVRRQLERLRQELDLTMDTETDVAPSLPSATPRDIETPTGMTLDYVRSSPADVHTEEVDRASRASRSAKAAGALRRLTSLLVDAVRPLGKLRLKPRKSDAGAAKGQPAGDKLAPELPQVLLSVSAPRVVGCPSTFTARFVAYIEEREAAVKQRLRELDSATSPVRQIATGLTPSGGGRWRLGTPVMVGVYGDHLRVQPATQSFEWNGSENLVSFLVTVLTDAPTSLHLCFEAFIEGVPVFFTPLEVRTGAQTSDSEPSIVVVSQAASTAFASYSSKDDALVKQCLSALKHWDPQISIFMDCLDLTPNAEWQRELEQVIPSKGAFLLFWSVNSMKSAWVAWEINLAESARGLDYIRPMPLDGPDVAPPPEKLNHLHFSDRYLAARRNSRWPDDARH